MLDKLDDKVIKRINKITFLSTQSLFGSGLGVVFFDATTLYFESFSEYELRRLGYIIYLLFRKRFMQSINYFNNKSGERKMM
jgi:hypothetical protein